MWSKFLEESGWKKEDFDMTLGEVLETRTFDAAEFVTNVDMECTLVWFGSKLSEEGKKEFKSILSLPVAIRHVTGRYEHDNIIFWYGASSAEERVIEKELRRFLLASAGYVSDSLYEKWFVEIED